MDRKNKQSLPSESGCGLWAPPSAGATMDPHQPDREFASCLAAGPHSPGLAEAGGGDEGRRAETGNACGLDTVKETAVTVFVF